MNALRNLFILVTILSILSACSSRRVTVLWGHQDETGKCVVDSLTQSTYTKQGYRPTIKDNKYYTAGPTLRSTDYGHNEWTILEPIVRGDSTSLADALPIVMKLRNNNHDIRSYGKIVAVGLVFYGRKEQPISTTIVCTER